MSAEELFSLFKPSGEAQAVRKDRTNATCQMKAWYFQTENDTLAYAVLTGAHGVREDIPALRKYYICSGEAVYTIDGKDHHVGTGSIVEIPAHSTYDLHSVGEEPVTFFVDIGVRIDIEKIPSS